MGVIDDSPPSLPPFLASLLSFGHGAGSVAWEPLASAHANPMPTLTAEGWGRAWREALPVEKPSSHPSLGGRGKSLYFVPTAHPGTSVFRIFLLTVCFHSRSWPAVTTQFLSSWGWLSGRSVYERGSRGLFLKLYFANFLLNKEDMTLVLKEMGAPDQNYLGHPNSFAPGHSSE